MRVLQNPEVFSNVVSSHVAIPNGMDPPEHTEYRRIVDKYFSSERIAEFELVCRNIAAALLSELSGRKEIEVAAELADLFAIRIQCAFLDWPATLHAPLLQWTRKNHAATLSGNRQTILRLQQSSMVTSETYWPRAEAAPLPPTRWPGYSMNV